MTLFTLSTPPHSLSRVALYSYYCMITILVLNYAFGKRFCLALQRKVCAPTGYNVVCHKGVNFCFSFDTFSHWATDTALLAFPRVRYDLCARISL